VKRRALTIVIVATILLAAQAGAVHLKPTLRHNSHCTTDEHVIFNCTVKAAKIVSLCASKDLSKDKGYLQYRFGLPGKLELEFPKTRTGTQAQFHYTHYFRYQVDLTEINFSIDGNDYQIFDTYNGEEKPVVSEEGVAVTPAGSDKEARFLCRGRAKSDYSSLPDVLASDQ